MSQNVTCNTKVKHSLSAPWRVTGTLSLPFASHNTLATALLHLQVQLPLAMVRLSHFKKPLLPNSLFDIEHQWYLTRIPFIKNFSSIPGNTLAFRLILGFTQYVVNEQRLKWMFTIILIIMLRRSCRRKIQ